MREELFQQRLNETGEVGYVDEISHSLVYANGLPGARVREVVAFETGELGQVLSISPGKVEISLFSRDKATIGTKVARTDRNLQIDLNMSLLGQTISPLGLPSGSLKGKTESRPVDVPPPGVPARRKTKSPLNTGVAIADLAVPLGRGQRELIIGDRQTGKTSFAMQVVRTQVSQGAVCVYCLIGRRAVEVRRAEETFEKYKITGKSVIVASTSTDTAGLVFLTPYSAMTVAEYFRDQGNDVVLVLDDLLSHANYHREVSLLGKRFPGRGSYPGDIFYVHARLLERAGNFERGSITCLPIVNTVEGDLTGYVQTNLMAITDGHIFFDSDLFNQGRRPAINAFLSVTRIGSQAQSPLMKDLSRELGKYLVELRDARQFLHFGAEISENLKRTLDAGDRVDLLFEQSADRIVPINLSAALLTSVWAGLWSSTSVEDMRVSVPKILNSYFRNNSYKKGIDDVTGSKSTTAELIDVLKNNPNIIFLK